MFDNISRDQFSHVLVFGNSMLGFKETGIVAIAAIVFKNDSRFHVFLVQKDKDPPEWMCQQYPVLVHGETILMPSFRGPIADDMLKAAERARDAIKKKAGRLQCEKVYKVSAAGVEEISLSEKTKEQCQTTTSPA